MQKKEQIHYIYSNKGGEGVKESAGKILETEVRQFHHFAFEQCKEKTSKNTILTTTTTTSITATTVI